MQHLRVSALAASLLAVLALIGAATVSADPLPYSATVPLPALGTSPAMASDAPFTPLVKSLIAQLLPSNPPTPAEIQNAAMLMHGTSSVPPVTSSEPCNTIGGNLARPVPIQ